MARGNPEIEAGAAMMVALIQQNNTIQYNTILALKANAKRRVTPEIKASKAAHQLITNMACCKVVHKEGRVFMIVWGDVSWQSRELRLIPTHAAVRLKKICGAASILVTDLPRAGTKTSLSPKLLGVAPGIRVA